MVNNWIYQCISQHEHCSYNKDAELPTRVLDVSHDRSQDVRLFVPGQHDLRVGRYTALSYCWGMTPCVKTTSLNFSDHLKNISFRSLPGTIQDAICITRALNIRFLWVDALCIIQGRDEVARKDWETESSKMRTVYGNAFVTLSAAGAPNCQAGIFFPRSPRSPVSLRFLAFNNNDMVDGYVYVDIPFRRFSLSDDEPIDKRAWTLQERLLSPRLVKYGTYAISWECHSASLAEFDAAVKTDSLKFYRLPRLLTTDHWMRVIEDYSSRNITFIEDRIPAISGIVQQFQKCLKMRYVAGLWDSKSDHTILLRLLIWHVVFDTEQQWNNMARLPGPTWSWLSVNTPVSWRYPPAGSGDGTSLGLDTRRDFVRWHAEIIDCQVRQDESSPLYPIKDGCITIRGILKQIKALTVGELRDQLYILDPPEDIGARRGVAKFDLVHDSPFQYIGGKTTPSRILHGENGIALPSCLYLADVKVKDIYDTAPCGILVAADHGSPQQWRKVGVFSLLDYEIYSVVEAGWLGDGVSTEIELI
jgi:Heterokaryon incompatibility protein (HET)